VVDDNQDAATSLATLLQMTGHESFTAFDGTAALEAMERQRPDVVLLDIGLPASAVTKSAAAPARSRGATTSPSSRSLDGDRRKTGAGPRNPASTAIS
jgi:DNA-binding response OmpR family regulator